MDYSPCAHRNCKETGLRMIATAEGILWLCHKHADQKMEELHPKEK